ncbi:UDP-N-acetylmuramoyl-L-alanine--D-glutamate ligase [Helicobacter burdigaliensis]|uniref:UDP-N-acetylmuramoyl-L-alanine--D-glutamate ligase n=1 Tax=Helicobacter burdigaliensis TaxID=2315334 RepID=UPI000EF7365A|nr:UDP-N-acetylmuramoyl-L-alanine--D-glutamate ligase [Helicobacter burdigaliensis]
MNILLGYGITNKEIAKKFAPCVIFDDSFKTKSKDEFNNLLYPANLLSQFLKEHKVSTIITSPGIPPYNPMIAQSNPISEYDFFASCMPYSIFISGTNGKTTTTQILGHLLEKFGAVCGGNIGTPLAALPQNAKIWILETSSFTLHYTKIAKPNLYLLLPISEDHISWHGSFEAYKEAKLKPLLSMQDKEVAILPASLKNHPFCKKSLATLIFYKDSKDLAETFKIDLEKINFKEPFLLDSLLALSATKILLNTLDYALLNSFKIGKHRLEEFKDKENRLYVDDSKGTNVDATLEALKRYKDFRILLILGGDDKGANLEPLFHLAKDLNIKIFAIGTNTKKITSLALRFNIECKPCYTLENAMPLLKEEHNLQSVALLSPAAASLDQFSSYKQRGELFVKLALKP